MISSTPANLSRPVPFIAFRDGTRLTSAKEVEDFHVSKKLKVSNKADFFQDVEILGDLNVQGSTTFTITTIPTVTKTYIDAELADIYLLLGWDNTLQKWIYSDQTNGIGSNLDARLNEINFENYYTKEETDSQILSGSTHSFVYYDGISDIYHGNEGEVYNHACVVVASGNHFVVPHSTSGLLIIQNSSYGVGKVLTSDAVGNATWQTPSVVTPTIENITTSNGRSDTASLTIKDAYPSSFEFLPDKLPNDYEIGREGDAVLRVLNGNLTLMAGKNTQIVRPSGIRISTNGSDGSLALFGGANFDDQNTTFWTRQGSSYLGYNVGNSIHLDKYGIHAVHDVSLRIGLYGNVHILQKEPNSPVYNQNTHIIPPSLTVGDATNGGNVTIYGNVAANSIKISSGASLNKVLTSDENGNASWQPTQATAVISSFTDDVDMVNLSVSNTTTTQTLSIPNRFTIKPSNGIITWIRDISDPNSYDLGANALFLTKNLSANVELERNIKHTFDEALINYASIVVPANYHKSVTFEFPIYLQHNYCYKWRNNSHYDNQPKNVDITYTLKKCTIKLLDNDTNALTSQFVFTDNDNFPQLGKVNVQDQRKSMEGNGSHVNCYNVELDRVKVNLIPPPSNQQKTYLIQVILQIEYFQSGSDLFPGDYQNSGLMYKNMSVSLGFYRFYRIKQLTDGFQYVYYSTLTSASQPSTFVENIYDIYGYPYNNPPTYRERIITWYKCKDVIRFQLVVPSPSSTLETAGLVCNIPMTTAQMTPIERMGIHYNSYEQALDKILTTSPLCVPKLFVRDNIECTGVIKTLGYSARRGYSTAISNEINIDKVNKGNIQQDCSIFNFYWTSGVVETWVDNTLVLTTPANYSDHRVKVHIEDIDDVDILEKICSIDIFKYTQQTPSIIASDGHVGFYAHDLQSTFPEFNHLVYGEKDARHKNGKPHYQTVNYNELTVLLMRSIQELEKKVSKQKKINRENTIRSHYLFVVLFIMVALVISLLFWKSSSSSSFESLCCHLVHSV
jgi:hypothetical protein